MLNMFPYLKNKKEQFAMSLIPPRTVMVNEGVDWRTNGLFIPKVAIKVHKVVLLSRIRIFTSNTFVPMFNESIL